MNALFQYNDRLFVYQDYGYEDETMARKPAYPYNEYFYVSKTAFIYWNDP